jgi:xylulokinase
VNDRTRDLILAVDLGTSAIKLAVLDRDLAVVARVSVPQSLRFPAPLWAEQDPQDWWQGLRDGVAALAAQLPDLAERVAAMGLASQVCGVVPVDAGGTPLTPCMIWLDKRSASLIRKHMSGFPKIAGYGAVKLLRSIQMTNGAPSLNGMDPTGKMMWLREHRPDVWARTAKLLDVRDWVVHRATGRFITTVDSANLSWLADTRGGTVRWSPTLARRYGVPLALLPEIVSGSEVVAGLTASAGQELGLPEGLPVVAGCSDICAAALGSGATADGALHICLGTSAWIAGFFDSRRINPFHAYATIASPAGNAPLLIASQESAGSCLDWLARLGQSGTAPQGHAQGDPPLFLPWLAGERVPVDDSRLGGAFLGLTLAHDSTSLAQAVAEGVALNLRWAMSSVEKQKGVQRGALLPVVGGATQNAVLIQALADCLQRDLWRQEEPQLAGLRGVGALIASGLGWIDDPRSAFATPQPDTGTVIRANPARAAYFDRRFTMFRAAHGRLAPWYHAHGREALQDQA